MPVQFSPTAACPVPCTMYHVCTLLPNPSFVLTPLPPLFALVPAPRVPSFFFTPLSSTSMRAAGRSVVNVPTTLTQDDTCRCSTTVLRVGGTHETRAASPSVR